jgi:hypothetical protein
MDSRFYVISSLGPGTAAPLPAFAEWWAHWTFPC